MPLECYPCDGRGFLIKEWGTQVCELCQGTGEAISFEMSTGRERCTDPRNFGRRKVITERELERRADRRAAIGFLVLAGVLFASSMAFDQPILALAAVVLLVTATIVDGAAVL